MIKHTSTQNVIERVFGVLKLRWRSLLKPFSLKAETAPYVIMSCFILHDICIEQKEAVPVEDDELIELLAAYTERFPQQGVNAPAGMGDVAGVGLSM